VDVLIFEPEFGGHYFQWVSYLLEAFLSRGDRVSLVTSTHALASKEYREYVERFRDRVEIVPIRGPAPQRARWHHRLRHILNAIHLVRTVRRRQPEHVLIPYVDAILIPLGLLHLCGVGLDARRRRIDVTLMRGEFSYPEIRSTAAWRFHPKWRFKEWILRKALRAGWFSRVLVGDDIAYRHMLGWQRGRAQLQPCPDPVAVSFPDRSSARRELGLDETTKILGCWGGLDTRKGIDLLLRGFAARPPKAEERLLLAGRLDPQVGASWSAMLAQDRSLAERVIIADRFLSLAEMERYVSAIDVAAVVYPAHVGSSRVLLEAAAAGKPILASQFGLIGHLVREHRLGYCCNVGSPEQLAKGLDWAFSAPCFDAESARRLARRNSVAEFQRTILDEAPRSAASRPAMSPLAG
jgi:glycosyltransferase involved in cell wall biosynthesis